MCSQKPGASPEIGREQQNTRWEEEGFRSMAEAKISLFRFSPGFGVKSKVAEIESRNIPLPFFPSHCLSLFPSRSLFLVLLIWSLEAGDTGAINHTVTGVDMSLSLMVMTRLALFPVLSHSRDGLWTQFI